MIKPKAIHCCLLAAIMLLISADSDAVEKNYSVTSISFGGYQTTDGEDTLTGSQFAIHYLNHFSKQWAFFIRYSSGSASGQHEEAGNTTDLKADTSTLTGGVQWSYDIDTDSDGNQDLTPYLGAGISLQRYRYEFKYEGSKIGDASGTGFGPFITLGLKIAFSSNFIFIPGYHYEQITIQAEDGSDRSVISSGVSLAFVARF